MLELKFEVDSSTLQLYFCDLHGDLVGESLEQTLAKETPELWITDFNARTVVAEALIQLVDVTAAKESTLTDKMYFEDIVFHPIKLCLSYIHTRFPRSKEEDVFSSPEYRLLKIVRSVISLDAFVVKVKSVSLCACYFDNNVYAI